GQVEVDRPQRRRGQSGRGRRRRHGAQRGRGGGMERLPRQPEGGGLIGKALGALGFKSAASVRSLSTTRPEGWVEPVNAGVPVTENGILGLSAAWACVNLLAGTIASLPIM